MGKPLLISVAVPMSRGQADMQEAVGTLDLEPPKRALLSISPIACLLGPWLGLGTQK